MNALHMLNERITKSFGLRRWLAFWHESQMSDWAGLILGQSPYCTNKNAVKCPCYARGLGGGGLGDFGLEWYIMFQKSTSMETPDLYPVVFA